MSPQARGRGRGFAAGVSATNDNDIVDAVHGHLRSAL
jgi:hypothetical protein